ncbi:MAG: hypothetical protein II955_05730, partial [Clostridia bacterium]|nr:hypothetical protein [Clostridia bacterium]
VNPAGRINKDLGEEGTLFFAKKRFPSSPNPFSFPEKADAGKGKVASSRMRSALVCKYPL